MRWRAPAECGEQLLCVSTASDSCGSTEGTATPGLLLRTAERGMHVPAPPAQPPSLLAKPDVQSSTSAAGSRRTTAPSRPRALSMQAGTKLEQGLSPAPRNAHCASGLPVLWEAPGGAGGLTSLELFYGCHCASPTQQRANASSVSSALLGQQTKDRLDNSPGWRLFHSPTH